MNTILIGSTTLNGTKVSSFSYLSKNPCNKVDSKAPKPLVVDLGERYEYKSKYSSDTSLATALTTGTVSLLMKEYSNLR